MLARTSDLRVLLLMVLAGKTACGVSVVLEFLWLRDSGYWEDQTSWARSNEKLQL